MRGDLLHIETATDENVLFLDAVTLSKGLDNVVKDCCEIIIGLGISRELGNGVLEADDGRVVTLTGVDNRHLLIADIYILDAVVNMLEDLWPLDASAEGSDTNGHANKHGNQDEYDY